MARLLAVLAAFLAAWFVLVGSAMAQEDNPFGNPALQERPRPQKRLIGRDAEGTPVEAVPLNPNVRPILIDDTQPPTEAPKEQHRVFGVSRRGELLARPQEEAATADTNQSIRAALASPTKMEFTEMPLVDGVAYLKDFHQIEIQMDEPALQAAGVGKDTPVTRNLSGLPLNSSLKLLLEPIGLTYLVRDGVLMITTEDAASKHLELKVYDVTKSIGPEVKAEEIAVVLASLNHPQMMGGGMGGGMGGAVAKTTDVRIVPFRNLLIVRASQREHEEIAALFGELQVRLAPED
jgi:hypothetical protein